MKKSLLLVLFLFSLLSPLCAEENEISQIQNDFNSILLFRNGLKSVIEFTENNSDLFTPITAKDRLLNQDERETIKQTWKIYLDYLFGLDVLGEKYKGFKKSLALSERPSFYAAYASFLSGYRYSLQLIDQLEKNPALDTLLNEDLADVGLSENSYKKFKFRFLNIARGAEFAAMRVIDKSFEDTAPKEIRSIIQEDSKFIWEKGKGSGEILTLKNGLDIIQKAGVTAWFPIQAGVADWMGDVKVKRKGEYLISSKKIKSILNRLQPGDILLSRKEWYLSNIGLPGYWTHSALYVGTPDERKKLFNSPEIQKWVKENGETSGDFELLLKKVYEKAYQNSLLNIENHSLRILEAVSEGVVFSPIEKAAAADSLAVLRPKLSAINVAQAIYQSFSYAGRPYDFNFDFLTDASLVCSELIFKAYENAKSKTGLDLPLQTVLGRPTLPPNLIVKQYDQERNSNTEQLELVLFLDGLEQKRQAVEKNEEEFRNTWKRPKWHILTQ